MAFAERYRTEDELCTAVQSFLELMDAGLAGASMLDVLGEHGRGHVSDLAGLVSRHAVSGRRTVSRANGCWSVVLRRAEQLGVVVAFNLHAES